HVRNPFPTAYGAGKILAHSPILGGLDDGCQLPKGFLHTLPVGDSNVNAAHPLRLSQPISEDQPFSDNPMNASIRPDHAPLTSNGTFGFIRRLYQPQDIASVVRMN